MDRSRLQTSGGGGVRIAHQYWSTMLSFCKFCVGPTVKTKASVPSNSVTFADFLSVLEGRMPLKALLIHILRYLPLSPK